MGLAIVAAFRWPALWAVPLLTKVTPASACSGSPFGGSGGLRDRRRRHGGPRGSVLPSDPALWAEYVEFLVNDIAHVAGWPFPYPLWLRLPLAVVLVIWGARTNRRWVVPAAALLALPRTYFQSLALLLALLPTFYGGWASIERWGPRWRRGLRGRSEPPAP